MFQVLVKTTAWMHGSYAYDLGDRQNAREFVQRPDVWWYVFPEDEDTLDGSSWRRGGAWTQDTVSGQGQQAGETHTADALPAEPLAQVLPGNAFSSERPLVPWGSQQVTDPVEVLPPDIALAKLAAGEDDDEDGRWLRYLVRALPPHAAPG